MKQTRRGSVFEAAFSTVIGLGVSVLANMTVLPWMGYPVSLIESAWLAVFFTIISVARAYCVRRLFEAWR